ncbi:ATP-binding protein [Pseudomonas vanderleydeniana]|uniref:Helix-turn-helix transcriptional regulator n=1 Tax=Pseudomonas vanderleydeniana TaxID=2745495 RepID=A0A9E6TQ15_9PSED|nr:winged helix-turn-helix domain-containing protein [Pseudomonas vanderleydeniana]QXI26021.1 helix-turn-helix transcriptional regulator [Pseudomonas vanderleydeniana]
MTLSLEQAVRFGPYRTYPAQRLIMEGDRPLRLGRRAMDILLILLEHAGQLVSKQELIARVWPDSVVEDINLRVHMAALRKALGDGQAGQRYIVTVAQRGYSFVAPCQLDMIEQQPEDGAPVSHNLPVRRTRMIGRQALLAGMVRHFSHQRFITLVGPGGIGKTTVALSVAEQLIGHYRDGIRLLDLAPLDNPAMVATHLATLLEVPLPENEPTASIVACLRERQMLLVIDNCEHLLDAVAPLCESLLRGAPQVHILATSRESLRAEGEFVQRLESLDCPPLLATLDRERALDFPALQLFVERAMASQDSFELTQEHLPQAIEICRRLDGIPLAIELAAAQVADLGLHGLLAQLQDSFRLLTQGSHAPLGRHQTLRATLDWSFELLSPTEQTCLRRLGIFRGGFTLASAAAVIMGANVEVSEVFAAITQLVAKSLLNVEVGDEDVFYRLLDTTRSYALEKLELACELPGTRRRHAERCLALMEQAQAEWESTPTERWIERYARGLEDLRAALEWGLGPNGPQGLAIRLTAASAPLWQELSLPKEQGDHVRKALQLLERMSRPSPHLTIALKLALGNACYHTHGGSAETIASFSSAQALAEYHGDLGGQLKAVSGHMTANLSSGNYRLALEQSRQFDQLALSDTPLSLGTQRLRVLALHYSGDQTRARALAEQVLQRLAQNDHVNRFTRDFGVQYDQSVAALTVLARILWLQGLPEQAWRTARQALDLALQVNHGTSICYTLALSGCLIPYYNGDIGTARELLQLLLEQAQKHSVALFQNWGLQYAQVLAMQPPANLMPTNSGLVKEIMVTLDSRFIDDTLFERAESGAAGWSSAEILRAQAEKLLAQRQMDAAESLLLKAISVAQDQGALTWELRSATSLARLWQQQGRYCAAHELLAAVHGRFGEGCNMPDLLDAAQLLQTLEPRRSA